eukprot:14162159-Alexandrium_andersonii.AAC.1
MRGGSTEWQLQMSGPCCGAKAAVVLRLRLAHIALSSELPAWSCSSSARDSTEWQPVHASGTLCVFWTRRGARVCRERPLCLDPCSHCIAL